MLILPACNGGASSWGNTDIWRTASECHLCNFRPDSSLLTSSLRVVLRKELWQFMLFILPIFLTPLCYPDLYPYTPTSLYILIYSIQIFTDAQPFIAIYTYQSLYPRHAHGKKSTYYTRLIPFILIHANVPFWWLLLSMLRFGGSDSLHRKSRSDLGHVTFLMCMWEASTPNGLSNIL